MTTESTQADGNTQTTVTAQPAAVAAASGAGDQTSAPASSAPAAASQQAPEGQTATEPQADAASTEGGKDEKVDPGILGAPEAYEFKPPEGNKFDDEVISTFSNVAKELDLSQGAAQKILDAIAPKVAERFVANQMAAIDKAITGWVDATKADKALGGEKLTENLAVAEKALAAFGTPELRKLLGNYDAKANPNGTGLGNHPEVIRAFFNAGKAISEDKFVPGGRQPTKGETNAARALYPNQA
jgi:hypothetical protein